MKPVVPKGILALSLLTAALAGGVLGGCGSDGYEGSPAPDYASMLEGSPPKLAAIHDQADELLPGGLEAYDARIAELKGFPVVVNVWASWCGPCRSEFPLLQQASAELGREVAFLGVNSDDDEDAAETFLSMNRLSYPSYLDPDKKIANDIGATHGFPATAFYDADGELTMVKHGEFRDQEELDRYIRDYAVEGRTG